MLTDKIYQLIPPTVREKMRTVYEKARKDSMQKFHSQFIKSGDLVFDIGANIGDYADVYAKLGAKVICLEPQHKCAEILRERFKDNSNIVIIEKGVSEKQGKMILNIDSENHSTATFSEEYKKNGPFKNRNWDKKEEVQVTTLQDLIKEYGVPSYCKIDVEGYEFSVFKGLKVPIKHISFEYSRTQLDEARKCLEYLETLGVTSYNFQPFLSSKLALNAWTKDRKELLKKIKRTRRIHSGDIFVKFE